MSDISQAAEPGSLHYTGRAAAIARMSLGIALLTLATATFYRFWGTTRLRRYLWSHVSFDGEPLEYLGRGSELFVGFLIAVAVLIPIVLIYSVLSVYIASRNPAAKAAMDSGQFAILYYLIYVALYRARRYRLTRTLWRGLRAGQTGSSWGYGLRAMMYLILVMFTAGLVTPVKNAELFRYRMNNTWYGNERFNSTADAGPLFLKWLVAWLLFLPTLGLSWVWYKAREERYLVSTTSFQSVRFSSTLTGRQLLRLYLLYALGVFATVGVFIAAISVLFAGALHGVKLDKASLEALLTERFIIGAVIAYMLFALMAAVVHTVLFVHRGLGMVCRNIVVHGTPDYATLHQSGRAVPGFGEGLADALGAGGV